MAIKVEETIESRMLTDGAEANQKRIELHFMCWDNSRPEANVDPVAVELALAAVLAAPPYGDPLYGLRLQTINLTPITKSIYSASVVYGALEPAKVAQLRFGLSTSGGSERITHSLATVNSYAATGFPSPPATNNGIQMEEGDPNPKGTQRLIAQTSFRVVGHFDPANWTVAQWDLLDELSGTWNIATWHGWPAQRLLFEFAECADYVLGGGVLVPVTFHFKARRFEVVNKGNGISFTKAPWEHVWDLTTRTTDPIAVAMGTTIRATYREQIYAGSDFTLLGLGS